MIDRLTGSNGEADRIDILLRRAEKVADRANRLQELARQLRAENIRLRRLTHMKEHVRMVRKAHEAALRLAALHLAGFKTGRRSALAAGGISERTFFYAKALCELANLVANDQFVVDDPELIEANLAAAARSAEKDFWLLLRRMPPSRRPNFG